MNDYRRTYAHLLDGDHNRSRYANLLGSFSVRSQWQVWWLVGRSAIGLPEEAFVYCDFNGLYKLDYELYQVLLCVHTHTRRDCLLSVNYGMILGWRVECLGAVGVVASAAARARGGVVGPAFPGRLGLSPPSPGR